MRRSACLAIAIALSTTPAMAGPICNGFWDCLPLELLLIGAFLLVYGSPVILTLTLAILLRARLRKKPLSAGWHVLLMCSLVLSSIGVVFVGRLEVSERLRIRRDSAETIARIEREGLQIYRIAGLQEPFAGDYTLSLDGDKRQAKIHIWKNGDELWADFVEYLGVPPDTSPDCPDGTLGQAGCPPFGATPRGTRVYYEARIPREFRAGRLIVSMGGTAITLEANVGDTGFSGPELERVYAMIDSLTLVTTDELRRYRRNLMDNLR